MLSKSEQPVVPFTHNNLEGIAEHFFSVNGGVGLPDHYCTVLAEDSHHAVGCIEGQSRLSRTIDHLIYF